MWIVALALRRPYTFTVFAILILIAGLVAITRTPKDIFPSINIPVISVILSDAGMSPDGIGKDLGTQLEIAQGLSPDDRVIINPSDSLASGQIVRIWPS